MNPQEQEHLPSFELPAAQATEQISQALPEQRKDSMHEAQSAIAIEQGAAGQAVLSQAAPPAQQATSGKADDSVQVGQPDDQGGSTPLMGSPQIADDNDLIEKEWVIRAKEIVARTAHDPHLQNREMNRFKADYLKKRYNKDVKLSEDT